MGKYSDFPSQTPYVRPRSAIYSPKRDYEHLVTFIWEYSQVLPRYFPIFDLGKDGEEGMSLNVPFILSKIVVRLACIADPNIKSPILRAGRGPYINSHIKLFLVSMHESTSGQPRPQGAFSKPGKSALGTRSRHRVSLACVAGDTKKTFILKCCDSLITVVFSFYIALVVLFFVSTVWSLDRNVRARMPSAVHVNS